MKVLVADDGLTSETDLTIKTLPVIGTSFKPSHLYVNILSKEKVMLVDGTFQETFKRWSLGDVTQN